MKEQPIPILLSRCVDFHGHLCPGLVIGYKASTYSLQLLGITPPHEDLFAIVSNNSCAFDAVQVITGCTFGKGNIKFWDHGKHVYFFGRRDNNQVVRLYAKGQGDIWQQYPGHPALSKKVLAGDANEREQKRFKENHRRIALSLLEIPNKVFFEVKEAEIEPPPKAMVFNNLRCDLCGEECMETRARICNGKTLCLPCFSRYCTDA
ncbi:MAG: formylmethanofuran dehydrogenase [Deltaproteobacteria bacterium]|nr:formylmethanofuran dehydrogenase [Deltaproteobacteria bacterium]